MINNLITRPEVQDLEVQGETPLRTAELLNRPKADGTDDLAVLFPVQESESFRERWGAIQGSFVDTPREAVQKADELVATIIQRLAGIYASERARLEADWTKGNEVSTEDLRQALRRYRSFFDCLLSV